MSNINNNGIKLTKSPLKIRFKNNIIYIITIDLSYISYINNSLKFLLSYPDSLRYMDILLCIFSFKYLIIFL